MFFSDDTGAFELGSVFNNARLPGACEGQYDVIVSSKFSANVGVAVYVLSRPVTIEPKGTC